MPATVGSKNRRPARTEKACQSGTRPAAYAGLLDRFLQWMDLIVALQGLRPAVALALLLFLGCHDSMKDEPTSPSTTSQDSVLAVFIGGTVTELGSSTSTSDSVVVSLDPGSSTLLWIRGNLSGSASRSTWLFSAMLRGDTITVQRRELGGPFPAYSRYAVDLAVQGVLGRTYRVRFVGKADNLHFAATLVDTVVTLPQ